MSENNEDELSTASSSSKISEEVKIAASWYDARVNGGVAAVLAIAFSVFGVLRLYKPLKTYELFITPWSFWWN
jgi:hypothetical protein